MVRMILPSATNETIARIQSLYQWPDTAPEQLAWQWTADAIFVCHNLAFAAALESSTRRYVMSIPPAYHGLDSRCKSDPSSEDRCSSPVFGGRSNKREQMANMTI